MQLHFKTNFTPTPALFNTLHISFDNPANNPYSPVEYHIEPVNTIYSPYGSNMQPKGQKFEQYPMQY
jgi:hypothetical protein